MSVNTGIDKLLYEDVEFALQYPTVDHIASLIARKGPGCLIYKVTYIKLIANFTSTHSIFLWWVFNGTIVIILM